MAESRRGLLLGLSAYVMWGAFPLYFPLLKPAGAFEILAHRLFWSCLTMGVVLLIVHRVPQLRAVVRDRRVRVLLALAATLVAANWVTYIWAVNNDRVVEASLGYFINPLVTVVMGIVILGERLRRLQWVAVGIATVAVVVLTVDYGHPPWISLVLALTFGSYGLTKKVADVEAVESLTFETGLLTPVALGYLLFLGWQGTGTFTSDGPGHAMLLATAGVVTSVPLLCFSAAAVRIKMVSLGLLQYVTPVLQFALGVLWFDEEMPAGRWIGFALVWLALIVFTVETLGNRRQLLRHADAAAAH